MKVTKLEFLKIVKCSISRTEVARSLGYNYYNGKIATIINEYIKEYDADIKHFKSNGSVKKWKTITKICPICDEKFETTSNAKESKITCSHSCANSYFRSGENNPNWKGEKSINQGYRRICFKHHDKKCIICGEDKIVDVHHFDKDHTNNAPENLIPLCPTHHKYLHSRHKNLILEKVNQYITNFKVL